MNLEDYVRNLVRQTINEWVAHEQSNAEKVDKPLTKERTNPLRLLILLPTRPSDAEQDQHRLESFSTIGRVTVCYANESPTDAPANSAKYTETYAVAGDREGWQTLVQQSDLLVVPQLTLGSLAKATQLIDDEPLAGILVAAMLNGNHIVVSSSSVLPQGSAKLSVPAAVANEAERYLQQLIGYGVRVTVTSKLHQIVKSLATSANKQPRLLIHAKHVREWVQEGETEITLPRQALVTQQAKDEAKSLGLRLTVLNE